MNCVITFEVYLLLRNNARVIRHKPPTLRRVSLQAGGVYLFSIIVLCTHFFLDVDLDDTINFILMILVTYVFPLIYFFSVWLVIKHRNYFPSLTGRWKELVSNYNAMVLNVTLVVNKVLILLDLILFLFLFPFSCRSYSLLELYL